jgi:hypothetical protein
MVLSKLAVSMWEKAWSPSTLVDLKQVESTVKGQTQEFISFACSMHFPRKDTSRSIHFTHLKFRDFCAVLALSEALKDEDGEVRWRSSGILEK